MELQNEEYEFHAAINGVDLSGNKKDADSEELPKEKMAKVPLFGDPAEFAKFDPDELQAMTEKMQQRHVFWSSDKKA